MSDTNFRDVDDNVLTEGDLSTVIPEILDVKAKYYQLGIALGLRPGEVDAIKTGSIGDVDQAFRKVVLTWLQQEYDVKRHGKPSWRRLLECIGSPSGGSNFALAMRLAGHHQVNAGSTTHKMLQLDESSPKAVSSDESVESINMGVEDLYKLLLDEFPADFEEDIEKIKDAKIDGEYFISILKGEESLEIEVSHGFKFRLNKKKQKLIDIIVAANSTDINSATKTPILPSPITSWCTTEFNEVIEINSDSECLPACASPRCVWRQRKELLVEFLDPIPNHWTYEGKDINIGNIISWANEWSHRGGGVIPSFKKSTHEVQSDIRVQFNNNGRCESLVGSKAQNTHSSEPTMWLDLGEGDGAYKKYLVIHEFGHALGLYHEHQRSDFWKHIEPYIDKSMMRTHLHMSEAEFEKRYGKNQETKSASCTEYDPKSVMHYWFRKEWLTSGYSNKDTVLRDLRQKKLSENSAKALLGVHRRHESLADEPSELDMELLITIYKDVNSATCTILGPPPTKKQRLSPDDYDYYEVDVKHSDVKNHFLSLIKWKESEDGEVQELRIYDSSKSKWNRIGRCLGFDEGHIESIGDDCCNNYSRVCKVFQEWFENAGGLPNYKKYPKTWEGMIALLIDSALTELSDKLKKALEAPSSTLKGDSL